MERMWGLCRHRSLLWCARPRMQVPYIFLSMKICQSWLSATDWISTSLKGLSVACDMNPAAISPPPLGSPCFSLFPSTSALPSWAARWRQQWGISHVLNVLIFSCVQPFTAQKKQRRWRVWCGCLQRSRWNSRVCMRLICSKKIYTLEFYSMKWLTNIANNDSTSGSAHKQLVSFKLEQTV